MVGNMTIEEMYTYLLHLAADEMKHVPKIFMFP